MYMIARLYLSIKVNTKNVYFPVAFGTPVDLAAK